VDSSQGQEDSSVEEQAIFKSLSPRGPAPTSPFAGGRGKADKINKLSILLEEKEGEDQDDSLHVDQLRQIKVSPLENNTASDAQEEIKQEVVD